MSNPDLAALRQLRDKARYQATIAGTDAGAAAMTWAADALDALLAAPPERQEQAEGNWAGRPALDPVSDAEVIAVVRGVIWDAIRGREIGGDRTLVGMVKNLIAERDEARANRRGEYYLRDRAERAAHLLRDAIELIAAPGETSDYGWWTETARKALREVELAEAAPVPQGERAPDRTALPPELVQDADVNAVPGRRARHLYIPLPGEHGEVCYVCGYTKASPIHLASLPLPTYFIVAQAPGPVSYCHYDAIPARPEQTGQWCKWAEVEPLLRELTKAAPPPEPSSDLRTELERTEPPLLHETKALNPWQPERDALALSVLGKFNEELNECGAIVARCIIQGIAEAEPVTGKPNVDALEDEIADVLATAEMLIEHYGLHRFRMERRRDRKQAHLRAWHQLIKEAALRASTPPHGEK